MGGLSSAPTLVFAQINSQNWGSVRGRVLGANSCGEGGELGIVVTSRVLLLPRLAWILSAVEARMVRKGERYRSTAPLEVIAMTAWAAPCIGGEVGVLPAGEEFVVSNDPAEGATAVYCDPVRYDQLHAHFVSAKDRRNKRYSGYYLCIDLGLIAERCERVG